MQFIVTLTWTSTEHLVQRQADKVAYYCNCSRSLHEFPACCVMRSSTHTSTSALIAFWNITARGR